MYGLNLKLTGVKNIESESNLLKYDTSNTEGDKEDNYYNVNDSLGNQNNPRLPSRRKKYNW